MTTLRVLVATTTKTTCSSWFAPCRTCRASSSRSRRPPTARRRSTLVFGRGAHAGQPAAAPDPARHQDAQAERARGARTGQGRRAPAVDPRSWCSRRPSDPRTSTPPTGSAATATSPSRPTAPGSATGSAAGSSYWTVAGLAARARVNRPPDVPGPRSGSWSSTTTRTTSALARRRLTDAGIDVGCVSSGDEALGALDGSTWCSSTTGCPGCPGSTPWPPSAPRMGRRW